MSTCRAWAITFAASSVVLSGVILLQLRSEPPGVPTAPSPPLARLHQVVEEHHRLQLELSGRQRMVFTKS